MRRLLTGPAVAAVLAMAPAYPALAELTIETIRASHPANVSGGDEEMVYEFPVVAGDSVAALRINTYLHAVELQKLPGRYQESIFEEVWPGMQPPFLGTTWLGFDEVSDEPGYISLALYYSYMAAYPSDGVRIYNFDAASGEPLVLSRLFTVDGFEKLRQRIIGDRLQRIDDFLAGREIDSEGTTISDEPDIADEQRAIYSDCRENVATADLGSSEMALETDRLKLTAPACAPHAQRAIDELGFFDTHLAYDELQSVLNDYGHCLLIERRVDCPEDGDELRAGVYRGKIDNRFPITLVLQPNESAVYFYDKYAQAIPLNASWQASDNLLLGETGEIPARFELRWSGGAITGTWTQEDKAPLSVELR